MNRKQEGKLAERLDGVKFKRKSFTLDGKTAREMGERDLEEYKASHPERFEEYNIRVG